uniref:Odorant receptor n=1 Tax=Protaetia brevitarsis TaxID=348688 RepID=A0A411HR10_PROBE|nr:odorant receptor [Protaetia brevitarsis]
MIREKSKERLVISEFFKPFLRILQIFSCYSPVPASSTAYKMYSVVEVTLLIFVPCFLKTVDVLQSFTELDEALATLLIYVTFFIYTLKSISLITQKDDVRKLVRCLDLDIFQPRNTRQRNFIKGQILTSKGILTLFTAGGCFTCTLLDLQPLLINRQERNGPINFWYPVVNTTKSPAYEIAYAYESIVSITHAFTHCVLDAINIICMAFIIGQLHSIEDTLINLRSYAEKEVNIKGEPNTTEKIHVQMNILLIECVSKHRALRRFANDLNKIYTNNFFLILANCMLALAFLMYKMSKAATLDFTFIFMIFYFGTMMTLVFMCNWYGNEIIYKSGNLHTAAYSMDWPGTPISFQKNLLFTIIHLQVPIKLYALNFFLLCLESYISVVKTSWSYFVMLTTVSNN